MVDSTFRGVLEFFDKLGIYDVVLPFLLTFAIVFAILEKTKILGTDEIDKVKYTKKNLNAIVSFVIAFFVVLSTKLVSAINKALANVTLLLILIVSYLLLVGAFFKEGEDVYLEKGGWRTFFMIAVFIGIVLIFMDALDWLEEFWDFMRANWSINWVSSLILLALIIFFMWFITKSPGKEKEEKKESK
jgi:hypothetical protein